MLPQLLQFKNFIQLNACLLKPIPCFEALFIAAKTFETKTL